MAVNPWKVVLIANSGKQGWSETYYTEAGSLAIATSNGLTLANIRQGMCPLPTKFEFMRVSQEGTNRKSRLIPIGAGTESPLYFDTWTAFSDLEGAAGKCSVYSDLGLTQRTLTLRGLSDDCFDRQNPANVDAQKWRGKVDGSLFILLTNSQWYIKSRGGALPGKVTSVISSWVNDDSASTSTMVLGTAIPGVALNSKVIIENWTGPAPAPGLMKVVQLSGDHLTMKVEYSLPNGFRYVSGSTAWLYAPTYQIINDLKFIKFGHHNTGRPFGGSRGRAPARAR